jgi:hypothetical protein
LNIKTVPVTLVTLGSFGKLHHFDLFFVLFRFFCSLGTAPQPADRLSQRRRRPQTSATWRWVQHAPWDLSDGGAEEAALVSGMCHAVRIG